MNMEVIDKLIRHILAVLIQHFEHKCNGSLDQSKTLHTHTLLPSSGQNLNCAWAGIIHIIAFLLHFKDDGTKKSVLFFTRSNALYSPTLISHFHKLLSVSFPMATIICISLLQGSEIKIIKKAASKAFVKLYN